MQKKMMMNITTFLALIIVFSIGGCEEATKVPSYKPKIVVDSSESTEKILFKVTYYGDDSYWDQGRREYVRRHITVSISEENMAEYKKQVQFLLEKLDQIQMEQEKRISK